MLKFSIKSHLKNTLTHHLLAKVFFNRFFNGLLIGEAFVKSERGASGELLKNSFYKGNVIGFGSK